MDGPIIVSACLGGRIKVWDSTSAECRLSIARTCSASANGGHSLAAEYINAAVAPVADVTSRTAGFRHSQSVVAPLPSNDSDDATVTTRRRHTSKHQRFKSADLSSIRFDEIAPDLSEHIRTDFVEEAGARRLRSDTTASACEDVTSVGRTVLQRSAMSASVGDVQQVLLRR